MKKKLILVTSPPACGKTYVAMKLAAELKHVVYLDKDALIILSRQIFEVANQPYDRSSDFFEEHIRDYEYAAILDMAVDALEYDDIALINAPFTREVRNPRFMESLRQDLMRKNARLYVVWVVTDPAICKKRMIRRNSDRDTWKLANWDEYMAKTDFFISVELNDKSKDQELLLFYNSNEEEFRKSMKEVVRKLQDEE